MRRIVVGALLILVCWSAAALGASTAMVRLAATAPYEPGINGYVRIVGGQASTNTDGTGIVQITVTNPSAWTYNRPWFALASDAGIVGGAGVVGGNLYLNAPTGLRFSPRTTKILSLKYGIPLDGLSHSITIYEDQAPGQVYTFHWATAVAILRFDLVAG